MPHPHEKKTEAEEQRTVRSALDSWYRTVRLCTIYIAHGVIPVAIVLPWLIRH